MMQSHTKSVRVIVSHADSGITMQSHAESCIVTQSHAESRRLMQGHTESHKSPEYICIHFSAFEHDMIASMKLVLDAVLGASIAPQ
jgi:hypothetical protein